MGTLSGMTPGATCRAPEIANPATTEITTAPQSEYPWDPINTPDDVSMIADLV